MEISFELFLPKDVDLTMLEMKESYVTFGGEIYSQCPAIFEWNKTLSFSEHAEMAIYERLLGAYVPLADYCVYILKGNALSDLEWCVNNELDVENNDIFRFINTFLCKIERWAILTLIDCDQHDVTYQVDNEQQALVHMINSLRWNDPKGMLLIKNKADAIF